MWGCERERNPLNLSTQTLQDGIMPIIIIIIKIIHCWENTKIEKDIFYVMSKYHLTKPFNDCKYVLFLAATTVVVGCVV